MLMSMRYRLVRSLIRLLLRCAVDERDLETAALRHQLKILRRGGIRPRFTDADRAFLAAAAGLLSQDRWKSFVVGPGHPRRWHRELSRRGPVTPCARWSSMPCFAQGFALARLEVTVGRRRCRHVSGVHAEGPERVPSLQRLPDHRVVVLTLPV
jgi:hypothetical protein